MNQARKRPMHQKVLSMILVLVMLLGLLSVSAFTMQNTTSSDSADSTEFMRIFHLDCGRKYFSVDQIKDLIDAASASNYTHVELAIGNDALRFLLDEMPVGAYTSNLVKTALKNGNNTYSKSKGADSSFLSESDMDKIIEYATTKGISIIPLINTPGHMDAVIYAMQELGMSGVSYNGSKTTIDVTNSTAVNFTKELLQLYVNYFADKGCKYFNMGADEYANDIYTTGGMGFGQLISAEKYAQFAEYVNSIAAIIKKAQMTPMAFNDGIYYNETTTNGNKQVSFDKDIVICYWTAGYQNGYRKYSPASASFLASTGGLKIINTNDAWYYVLGRSSGSYALSGAQNGVKNTRVTDVPGNNDPVPIGAMMCLWCDTPSASYSNNSTEQNNVKSLIQTLAAKNPTYFTKSTPSNPDSGTTEDGVIKDEKVEVPVGSDWTKTIKNVDLSGRVGGYDQNVAKVTVSYDKQDGGVTVSPVTSVSSGTAYYIQSSDGKYLDKDANWVDDPASAAQWTCTDSGSTGYYFLKNGSSYLYYSNGSFTTTNYSRYASYFTFNNGSFTTYFYNVSLGSPVTITKSDPVNASKITITGLTAGQTTVKIGDVTYHITVTDKAPSNAMKASTIKLEYWITNQQGHTSNSKNAATSQTITSSEAQTETGIEIKKKAPENTYSDFTGEGWTKLYYWQAMRLDARHQQTDGLGVDQTAEGTTLTHIRYHGGAWQYKTTDSVWHYFVSTDQLVAYYLQKTEVTKEIETYVKDWGYVPSNKNYTGNLITNAGPAGSVALTVAVVYPDGTVSPAEGTMYANSTTIFNYWSGRDIGIVAPKNNSDYNISKITVTDGRRTRDDDDSGWDKWHSTSHSKPDSITWKKTTDSATGKTWYDEQLVWDKSYGTTPMVNGKTNKTGEITWSAKNNAKLVLIYLETVTKETNLNVVYWDDNAGTEIVSSQIAMSYKNGDPIPSFMTALKDANGKTEWPSKDPTSSNYLPDEAYVTNSSGVPQHFNKDLLTVSGVTGVYASGLYEYVSANISDDGKTLVLHYNLKQTNDKTYVLDFGLPIKIPAKDFGIENYKSVASISFDSSDTTVKEKPGEYGKGKIDMSDGSVTYTLTKAIDSKVAIPIYVTFNDSNVTKRLQVYVIPATSVYYEDSFAKFTNADGTTDVNKKTDKGFWTTDNDGTDQSENAKQALEALGSKKNVYGYDDAYANSSKFSMGSATKVTVAADTSKLGQSPTATFTFKGTGFDVISLTGNQSGTVLYTVTNTETRESSSNIVDTYYGYKYVNGKWVTTDSADPSALYQIPVIKECGLPYGTYEVTISVLYGKLFNSTSNDWYTFWLDAIRVYDPMNKDNATYTQDDEGYPQYIKLRDALADGSATAAGKTQMVFIDGGSTAEIKETYANCGPNNEVYLAKGQAIAFNVSVPNGVNVASIQIGAKAPEGNAAEMSVGDKKTPISSATEMYYTITSPDNHFTITNTGNGILSLTNLKITFNTKPSGDVKLAALTTADQENAVAQVRALFAAPAEPFLPDRFKASWGHAVRKGDTATLTVKASEDVEAITVDGRTITAYATKTERTGWGWWAKTVTYREFTYTDTAVETKDYTVCAVNSDGVSSDPITARLTVRPSVRDWWHGIFDKWF